jgi:hypothetical protein
MKQFSTVALLLAMSCTAPSLAQDLPDVAIYRAMLDANKASGWVAFRNYDGQQWIYFTPLVTMHCRLADIRYSINSDALDESFPLPECNPALPFSLPSDAGAETIALNLPLGTAETVAVQVVWDNDKESEVLSFKPCPDIGDSTCALPADQD